MNEYNILGLGKFGCDIAELFETYPQYQVYKIDIVNRAGNALLLPRQNTPEEYEDNFCDISSFLSRASGSITVILDGSELVNSSALMLLEQIKELQIDIVYFRPDLSSLSEKNILHERIARGILQEFARSGLFSSILLFDLPTLESAIGEIPVRKYKQVIKDTIFWSIYNLQKFNNVEPVLDSQSSDIVSAKIHSLGIVDMEKNEEKPFYLLDGVMEKVYYFNMSERRLNEDFSLLNDVKKYTSSNPSTVKTSFSIYSSEDDVEFSLCLYKSALIQ